MNTRPFVAAVVLLASATVFFAVTASHGTMLWYVPSTGAWTWSPPPGVIAMDWFYRAGAALLAGAFAFPVARAVASRAAWARRIETRRTLFGLAFAVIGWCVLYITFALITTPR